MYNYPLAGALSFLPRNPGSSDPMGWSICHLISRPGLSCALPSLQVLMVPPETRFSLGSLPAPNPQLRSHPALRGYHSSPLWAQAAKAGQAGGEQRNANHLPCPACRQVAKCLFSWGEQRSNCLGYWEGFMVVINANHWHLRRSKTPECHDAQCTQAQSGPPLTPILFSCTIVFLIWKFYCALLTF